MDVAYVDTSCLVAIAFEEGRGASLARRLKTFDELVSSNLLEAELRAVFLREKVPIDGPLPLSLSWLVPDRTLGAEISRVLSAGYVRGADCWHLAAALYLAPDPKEISFVTADSRQAAVAKKLGFRT
jgi:predicted nucleic acid-binding protein